jgi:allantoin racemase
VQDEKADAILALVRAVVKDQGADVAILAGAPLSGLADKLRDRSPIPLIDSIQAAVKQAEALVSLRPAKATAGTFARPPAKTMTGVAPALARHFDRTD